MGIKGGAGEGYHDSVLGISVFVCVLRDSRGGRLVHGKASVVCTHWMSIGKRSVSKCTISKFDSESTPAHVVSETLQLHTALK